DIPFLDSLDLVVLVCRENVDLDRGRGAGLLENRVLQATGDVLVLLERGRLAEPVIALLDDTVLVNDCLDFRAPVLAEGDRVGDGVLFGIDTGNGAEARPGHHGGSNRQQQHESDGRLLHGWTPQRNAFGEGWPARHPSGCTNVAHGIVVTQAPRGVRW